MRCVCACHVAARGACLPSAGWNGTPPAPIVAVAALVAAAATDVARCWQSAAAFDARAIGADPASVVRSRYASLRASLPPQAGVCVVSDERELDAGQLAVVDVFAAALH